MTCSVLNCFRDGGSLSIIVMCDHESVSRAYLCDEHYKELDMAKRAAINKWGSSKEFAYPLEVIEVDL